jgi:Skp family chaperone for outer membrane proteins
MRTLLALVAVCCCVLSAADAAFPKLAVLRLDDVMRQSKVCNAALDANRKLKSEAEAKLGDMDKEIQQLDNALQLMDVKHEKHAETSERLALAKFKQKQYFERMKADIDRKTLAGLRDSFTAVRGHLKDFCAERGILLVAQVPQPDLVQSSLSEATLQLGLQSVLYADASLDITDPFLAYSNGRFGTDTPAPTPEQKPQQ